MSVPAEKITWARAQVLELGVEKARTDLARVEKIQREWNAIVDLRREALAAAERALKAIRS